MSWRLRTRLSDLARTDCQRTGQGIQNVWFHAPIRDIQHRTTNYFWPNRPKAIGDKLAYAAMPRPRVATIVALFPGRARAVQQTVANFNETKQMMAQNRTVLNKLRTPARPISRADPVLLRTWQGMVVTLMDRVRHFPPVFPLSDGSVPRGYCAGQGQAAPQGLYWSLCQP